MSPAKTHKLRHGMLLISARTLMSLYKKGLNGLLVCKNLYDPLTPIPVSKFKYEKKHSAAINSLS